MGRRDHWEAVYTTKKSDETSWFQARPERSLAFVRATGAGRDAGIIDVGGGDSRLVDVLVDEGYADLTVLDISAAALARARNRLGAGAAAVDLDRSGRNRLRAPAHLGRMARPGGLPLPHGPRRPGGVSQRLVTGVGARWARCARNLRPGRT